MRPTNTDLFMRMLQAAGNLPPTRAAVLGMHWERWSTRQIMRKQFMSDVYEAAIEIRDPLQRIDASTENIVAALECLPDTRDLFAAAVIMGMTQK